MLLNTAWVGVWVRLYDHSEELCSTGVLGRCVAEHSRKRQGGLTRFHDSSPLNKSTAWDWCTEHLGPVPVFGFAVSPGVGLLLFSMEY